MGRCRPFPDAAGCRWPRLNGKIDNILPNFSLFDSNETLNFKFVYNKWKSTRCKKTLNKQKKHNETKWQKTRFLQASKIHWTFQVCHLSPTSQWKSTWAGGGRLTNISNAAVKRLYMYRCNNYPWKPLSTIVTTRPDQRQYFPATIIALVQMLLLQPLRESSALSVGWFSVGLSTCLFSSMQKAFQFLQTLQTNNKKNLCLMKTKLKFWFQCSVNVTDYLGKSDAF